MKFREVISKQIEHESDGLSVAGGLSAVVAANVNEHGPAQTSVSTRRRIVQDAGASGRRADRDGNRRRRHQ
jgi:hypothetical protein